MLGADTRATEGPIVADKNCEKIHFISKNIYCCGAGTSADTENTTYKGPLGPGAHARVASWAAASVDSRAHHLRSAFTMQR